MIIKSAILAIILSIGISNTYAVICGPSGGVRNVEIDITGEIQKLENNAIGRITDLSFARPYRIYGICPAHDDNSANTTLRDYRTNLPIIHTEGLYKFLRINEYVSGAMRIYDSTAGYFYPPEENVQMGTHPNVSIGSVFPIEDLNFLLKLRVERPFIGYLPISTGTMFYVYVKTKSGETTNNLVYTISYTGYIHAPQSCVVGSGSELNINFGEIAAYEFSRVGIGEKPINVETITRTINIQCSNINDMAKLHIRVIASAEGDNIISTNKDVGFRISDINNNVLTPNNMNSNFPFYLENSLARINLKFWPISLTGKRPEPGPFRSVGHLRVDFD